MISKSIKSDTKMSKPPKPLNQNMISMTKQPVQNKVGLTAEKMQPVKALPTKLTKEMSQGNQFDRPTAKIGELNSKLQIQAAKGVARTTDQVNRTETKSITRPSSGNTASLSQRSSFQTSCSICLESLFISKARVYLMKECGRRFHFECLKSYILQGIKSSKFSFRCPDEGCKSDLGEFELSILLPRPERDLAIKKLRTKIVSENPSRLAFCSTPDCLHIFSIPEKDPSASAKCPVCKKTTCLLCKAASHMQLTCEEFRKLSLDDFEAFNYFNIRHWKRCVQCNLWIDRLDGCLHVECVCGYGFCHNCGMKWKRCSC